MGVARSSKPRSAAIHVAVGHQYVGRAGRSRLGKQISGSWSSACDRSGGLENGKKLSDFPEFSRYIKRMAAFRKTTERFWVGGSFRDDIGLKSSGAFAKVYQTDREVAIVVANLGDEAAPFAFDLDAS